MLLIRALLPDAATPVYAFYIFHHIDMIFSPEGAAAVDRSVIRLMFAGSRPMLRCREATPSASDRYGGVAFFVIFSLAADTLPPRMTATIDAVDTLRCLRRRACFI